MNRRAHYASERAEWEARGNGSQKSEVGIYIFGSVTGVPLFRAGDGER